MIIKLLRAAALLICTSSSFTAIASEFPAPLPADSTLKVETLPAKYPTGWAFLNYAGDRIELRNVGSDSREVKGQLQARDSATLLVSTKRPELYIADTVWSRGVRGTRTDFITIYDTQTLNPVGRDRAAGRQARVDHGDGRAARLHRRSAHGVGFRFHARLLGDGRRPREASGARRDRDSRLLRSSIRPATAAFRPCARAALC